MTDPVTNVEIEDVLSSIRRLVSDDARTIKDHPKAVKQPERLVLTPALRVSDDKADDEGGADLTAVGPDAPLSETLNPTESNENDSVPILLTELAPLVEEATPELERSESTDDLDQNDMEDVSFVHAADVIDAAENTASDDPEAEDVSEPDGSDAGAVAESSISDTAAKTENENGDAIGRDAVEELTSHLLSQLVEEEVEQALADVDVATVTDSAEQETDFVATDGDIAVEELQDVLTAAAFKEDEAVTTLIADERDTEGSAAESLESKIAALEELVGRSHEEDWEPEPTEPEAPVFQRSSDVLEWQDHQPDVSEQMPEAADAPDKGDQPTGEEAERVVADPSVGGSEAVVIDEDTLRGMVSEIVRQELQGALGERITRNVRKLVRREIHRVLMSQDFD